MFLSDSRIVVNMFVGLDDGPMDPKIYKGRLGP